LLDWTGAIVDPRPLSLLPPLAAIAVGWRWIRAADLARGSVRLVTTAGVIGIAAAVFGVVDGRWRGEGLGLLLWLAPLAVAAVLLVADRDETVRPDGPTEPADAVLDWLLAAAVVAAVVAVVQWLVLPPWDALWIRTAVINTVGEPAARSFRPFGPLNAPAVLGVMLAAGLLVGFVRRSHPVPLALIAVALVMSEQRTAWVAAAVAIVALILMVPDLRGPLGRTALVILAVSAIGFAVSGGARTKLDRTLTGTSDVSVAARLDAYGDALGQELWTLTGSGLGSVGVAATAEDESPVSIDGVIPRDVHRLGGLLTTVHVAVLASLAALGARAAPSGRAPAAAWAVVVVTLVAGLGTNTIAGATGLITWSALGLAALQVDQAGRTGGLAGAT
jgi:hypothetical protein